MKKKDLFLIIPLFAAALVLFIAFHKAPVSVSSDTLVRVYVNGDMYTERLLVPGDKVVIHQENGCENTLVMTENGFYMDYSSCKNQLCVGQGEVNVDNYAIRSLGTHIICLPNRIDAELVLSSPASDPLLPDV